MLSSKEFRKLKRSLDWSVRQLDIPRRKYREAIKLSCGYHYSEGGTALPQPLDFLKMAERIYVRLLMPHAPRALFSTTKKDLKPTAANLELAVNAIPAEIDLENTLRLIVSEAIYGLGVAKCGLHTTVNIGESNYGSPFVDCVTFDDYFCDMAAKRWDTIQYEGNEYWMNYEDFMEADWAKKKSKDNLKPDEYTLITPEGVEKAKTVTTTGHAELFKDKIWLRDVWLPQERVLLTYGVTSGRLFNQVEWDDESSPYCGPYHRLGFIDVPGGNLLFMSPVALWRDLHELSNTLFRKLGRQAKDQKTVQGFSGGNDEDAINFRNANDGEGIVYSGQPPTPLRTGGVDQITLAFMLQCKNLASYFAGNLDSLGGLSPMAETVGQEKLISEAASALLRDMAVKTVGFTKGLFRSLAKYEWYDPVNRRILQKPVAGTDITIPVKWNRKAKKGKFSEYDIDIDVYSLQDKTPSIQLQKLRLILKEFIEPMYPMIQQGGGSLDVQKILDLVAKYSDFQELKDIITWTEAQPQPQNIPQQVNKKSESTYNKISGGKQTQQGQADSMMQMLLGKNLKESAA